MALEGNAKDFGLSEIFQLISLQKKSGILSVTAEVTRAIFFHDGEIVSTRDRRDRTSDPLKEYLLRYGFVAGDEMERIQRIQTQTNLDLVDILVSEKYFSEDELKTILADQIQETMQEILSWPKSYYKFIAGSQVVQGVRSFVNLKVEALLMESMRRIDEYPEMLRLFPTDDTVLTRLPLPAEKALELDEAEEAVYEILEQHRLVGDIVPRARMSRFATLETLKNLLEKGLLQIAEGSKPTAAEAAAEPEAERGRSARLVAPALAAAGIIAACAAIGELVIPAVLPPGWAIVDRARPAAAPSAGGAVLAADLDELRIRQAEAAVVESLEERLAATGAYPQSLAALAAEGCAPRALVDRAAACGLRYRLADHGRTYVLERASSR